MTAKTSAQILDVPDQVYSLLRPDIQDLLMRSNLITRQLLPALLLLTSLTTDAVADIDGLAIEPNFECIFLGPVGGPFSPTGCDFSLANSTPNAIQVDARFGVSFEPPWMEGLLNNDPQPMNSMDSVRITVPANGAIPFTLRLTDTVSSVQDEGFALVGDISFTDSATTQMQTSAIGTLQFIEANDNFAGALPLRAIDASVSGFNTDTTKEPGEPNHAGNPGGASVWFRYDAPTGANGQIRLFTEPSSDIDTLVAVYTGSSVNALTLIAESDNVSASNNLSDLTFDAIPDTSYFVAVDGANGETGFYQLAITENFTIVNDDFADATSIVGLAGSTNQLGSGAASPTREPGEPAHGGSLAASVWFDWTAPATGVYRFSAGTPSEFPVIAIYLGSSVDQLIEVASVSTGYQLDVLASSGGEYRIALGSSGLGDRYPVAWELLNPQPTTGLFASILPSSRAVGFGQIASVFANTLNSSGVTGLNCRPEAPNQLRQFTPTGFDYQTTDAQNLLVGTPNAPVDIPPGGLQNWLLQINSPANILSGSIGIRFVCDNIIAAPVLPAANGWLLRVLNVEPADVIAIGLSTGTPGIVDVPQNSSTAFAAAGVNIGPGAPILVQPESSFTSNLSMTVCETDTSSQCLSPATPTLMIPSFARDQLRTFSVFVTANNETIAFDPGFNRIFLKFIQGATEVGATSLAIRTE